VRNTYTCDICGNVVHERTWEDAPYPVQLCIYTPSQNPLGPLAGNYQTALYKREEVCPACRRRIAQALFDILTALQKKEEV